MQKFRYRAGEWTWGLLVLLLAPGSSRRVAAAEHRRWLDEEPSRSAIDPARIEEHRANRVVNTQHQAANMRRQVYGSFGWILFACVVALVMIRLLGWPAQLSRSTGAGIASVIMFSSATLGRLSSKTWSGDSLLERLDAAILWSLYWLGTLLAVIAAVGIR
jgi:hypothetical protein